MDEKRKVAGKPTDLKLCLPAELIVRIDAWADRHDVAARADAARKLIEIGLVGKVRHSASSKQRERAATLAGRQIDQMADVSASSEVRATRKIRLTEGPSMVRSVRRDRSKKTEAK